MDGETQLVHTVIPILTIATGIPTVRITLSSKTLSLTTATVYFLALRFKEQADGICRLRVLQAQQHQHPRTESTLQRLSRHLRWLSRSVQGRG